MFQNRRLAEADNPRHPALMPVPSRPVFRPPFSIEEHPESFVIKDADDNPLSYIYFEDSEKRRHMMNRLTKDEARRMAVQIARIPELLKIEKQAKAEAAGASFDDV